jgi:FemAB-related protein (PEP-CTERM system-associated)
MRTVVSMDLFTEADFQRWQAYILAHPDTQYADLGEWRRIFRELYGIQSVNFACIEDGRTVGVASLYLIASPFFGRLLVTCPFFGSGGLYADDAAVEEALLDRVHSAARELRADFVELRSRRPFGAPYKVSNDFFEFELALEGSAETVWNRSLSSNARQNVRKSEKYPLVFSTTRDPGETFLLLSTTLRDLGTPFHARRFFDLVVAHLGEAVQFSQVRLGGLLVAAGVMIRFRDRLSTPYIGSLKRFRETRANYCQYWGIIRHCLENGVRCFDLGRSPRGSSHQQFKEKWGAVPVIMHYCHQALSTRRAYRTVLERSRMELLASGTWKHLPLFLTRRIGHWACRFIP